MVDYYKEFETYLIEKKHVSERYRAVFVIS